MNWIGTRWLVNGTEWYVWDIAWVKLPDNRILAMRWEMQSASDYVQVARTLADFPEGTVQLFDSVQVNVLDWIEFTDEQGRIEIARSDEFLPGAIGEGGVIANPSLISRGGCRGRLGTGCDMWPCYGGSACVGPPACHCIGGIGHCSPIRTLECDVHQTACPTWCSAFCRCL